MTKNNTILALVHQTPASTLQPTLLWQNTGCGPSENLASSCGRAVVQVQAAPWESRQMLVFSWALQNAEEMRGANANVQLVTQLRGPVVAQFCKVANESGPGCVEEAEVLVVDRHPGELQ